VQIQQGFHIGCQEALDEARGFVVVLDLHLIALLFSAWEKRNRDLVSAQGKGHVLTSNQNIANVALAIKEAGHRNIKEERIK